MNTNTQQAISTKSKTIFFRVRNDMNNCLISYEEGRGKKIETFQDIGLNSDDDWRIRIPVS